jgi:septum formation protein
MPARFILASQSPRRLLLLRAAGYDPEVRPANVDETPLPDEPSLDYASRVARAKALACEAPQDRAVLAADTVVSLDGAILGKAATGEEAVETLCRLSGRTHQVHTAVALRRVTGALLTDLVTTEVRFRTLSDAEIRAYVVTGEPMDKAGAYGIQGRGGALVAEVHGSYTNVVGLPLEETLRLLRLAGVD